MSRRDLLIAKLADSMDPDNATALVDEVIREAAEPPLPHYESGNCPFCGAWVNFAQEAEIAKIEAEPPPPLAPPRHEDQT